MANLPSNIYSGGAVVLDSTPYTNFVVRQRQIQQAKDEAVSKYYEDFGKTLTPTGMAGNDVPDFVAKKNAWQQYVTDNMHVLSNPKNPNFAKTLNQATYLYNDAQGHVAQSLNKVKNMAEAATIMAQYNKKNGATQSTIDYLHELSKPVISGITQFDPSKITPNPDDFDPKKFIADSYYGLKPDRVTGDITEDKATHKLIMPYTESFSQDTRAKAANVAAAKYDNSDAAQAYFENVVHDEVGSPEFMAYNNAFKDLYGRDIVSPKDAAVGFALYNGTKQNTGVMNEGTDPIPFYDYRRAHPMPSTRATPQDPNAIVNDVYKGFTKKVNDNYANGVATRFNQLDDQEQAIARTDIKNAGGEADGDYIFAPDKNGDVKIYTAKETKRGNGQFILSPETELTTLSPIGTNLKVQANTEGKKGVVDLANKNNPNATPQKTYKYKSKPISIESIQKAAKASGMTVDEYIKAAGIQ